MYMEGICKLLWQFSVKIHATEGELFTIYKPCMYCFSLSEKPRMNNLVCYGNWFGGIVLFFERVGNCANCLQIFKILFDLNFVPS